VTLRTGQVVAIGVEGQPTAGNAGGAAVRDGGALVPGPAHTVGDHVLVRGRWLSVRRLGQALARIDGIARWELVIARSGTLDQATLRVTFTRPSLTRNPMWRGRIAQAIAAVTPVTIEVAIAESTADEAQPPIVTDQRGQHLGLDRAKVG
jgi:phenylacetate-CoA ligase